MKTIVIIGITAIAAALLGCSSDHDTASHPNSSASQSSSVPANGAPAGTLLPGSSYDANKQLGAQ